MTLPGGTPPITGAPTSPPEAGASDFALVIPPEPPLGTPALDPDGDAWQRGDDGWWPAIDQAWTRRLGSGREVREYDRPWTWGQLWAVLGEMRTLEAPAPAPTPDYTGELPVPGHGTPES